MYIYDAETDTWLTLALPVMFKSRVMSTIQLFISAINELCLECLETGSIPSTIEYIHGDMSGMYCLRKNWCRDNFDPSAENWTFQVESPEFEANIGGGFCRIIGKLPAKVLQKFISKV